MIDLQTCNVRMILASLVVGYCNKGTATKHGRIWIAS